MDIQEGNIRHIRNEIVDVALVVFSFFGLVGYVPQIFRVINEQTYETFLVQSVAILVGLTTAVFRKRMKLETKVYFIVSAIFVIFSAGMFRFGFLASSKIYASIVTVFVSFLFPVRKTLVILSLYLTVYFLFGILFSTGMLSYEVDAANYIVRTSSWLLDGLIITLTAVGLLYVGQYYSKEILANNNIILSQNAELKDREEKFRYLFEQSNDAIMLIENYKYAECNPKALELFQCEAEFILGKNPQDFSPEMQPDGVSSNDKALGILRLVIAGIPQFFEWEHLRPNGERFFASVSLSLVELKEKKYIQAVLRDITERKQKDAELEQYRSHLEKLVTERTKELQASNEELTATNEELQMQGEELRATITQLHETQDQLAESEKMASLGVLTAGVAHEINNPLNFIQSGIYGLKASIEHPESFEDQENLSESQKEVLANIENGVIRINKIVKSLNHFSRNSGEEKELCDLEQILNNCLLILQHKIQNNVVVTHQQGKIRVVGFEGRLHQAFLNLLNNAIQAVGEKGKVEVFTQLDTETDTALIKIKDNGKGIAPEHIKRVFEPFFTTKAPGEGTGLGLSIVYKIIKDHAGGIKLKSELGVGTEFTVTLPASV